ncbi:MAG: IS6 family transposase [Chloroflexota bacterium]|nr:IS6 family transposase [Chloroflexota bacterium]MDE2684637.1 IS6 family transposase [Chloroflexota bacterium]
MAEFTKTVTVNCPYCGDASVVKFGRNVSGHQRYRCKPCGKTFLGTGALHGRKVPSNVIGAAVQKFYRGMSYKSIAEQLAQDHDIPEPSKQTIYAWVKKYTDDAVKAMSEHPAETGPEWVADEMMVDVGGQKMWNWNVMDAKTRYILASYLSPRRDTNAATRTLRKAARFAANPPERIRTDKLGSYTEAIKRVFPDAKHIQSDGITAKVNNNLSERLQGTFRQRTKTLRGLDSRQTGQRYLDGWVVTYNLFRDHEGADGKPPAVKAGVKPPFEEWADVVRKPVVSAATRIAARRTPAKTRAKSQRGKASAGRLASAQPKRAKRR